MQTRLLRWNYSIISKFVNGLYNTLHRITCTLHKLKSRFSLELPTRFQSIHQWKGCILYIVSRIKHTQYSCNKTIILFIYDQWCWSGSGRIRIHLGLWVRIQRYKMKEKTEFNQQNSSFFSQKKYTFKAIFPDVS